MTAHLIDLLPATPPELITSSCRCNEWSRTYRSIGEWSDTLDAAQRHVAGLCGNYHRDDNGYDGTITISGQGS